MLQNSRVKSAKLAFRSRLSSKFHSSSLQNERLARDFLKNSLHFARFPPKVTRQSLQSEHFARDFHQKSSRKPHRNTHTYTHTHTQTSNSPAKQFCDSIPSNQHPRTGQSQCHSDIHLHRSSQPHDSLHLRLLRKFARPSPRLQHELSTTSATPRNLTIPCAYHQKCTSTLPDRHKVLRLPRKVTSAKFATTPHVGTISARSEHTPTHQNHNLASKQQPETQVPMSQPHPPPKNTTPQTPIPYTCAVKSCSTSYVSTRFLAISHESDTSCVHPKPSPKLRQCERHSGPPVNGCERYENESRTRLHPQTSREQDSTLRPPELNGNPSLRIREKPL